MATSMKILRSGLQTSLFRNHINSRLASSIRHESSEKSEKKTATIQKLQRELDREVFALTKNVVKRFYKGASVAQVDDIGNTYEILLDHRKLKTRCFNQFIVPNKALALAIQTEWDEQDKKIERHTMHMTHLANLAIDNPTNRSKETVANGILEFLETDTICYRCNEPPELEEYQNKHWNPLIEWVEERYDVKLPCTTGFMLPETPKETKDLFYQHIMSHTEWSVVGFQSLVESLKSFVISLALLERHISVREAVRLARLEAVFQTNKWGTVEWYHDVEVAELQAKVAAASVFIHLCNETRSSKTKGSNFL